MTEDLNEKSLLDALVAIRAMKFQLKPQHLVISEEGIALQARNYRLGIITEADMIGAGIPQDLIDEVKRIAEEG